MRKYRIGLRAGWVALTVLGVVAVLLLWFNLPTYFRALSTICTGEVVCEAGQLRPAEAAELNALGLPLVAYAVFSVSTYLALTVACWTVAAVLVARRANEPVALLAAMVLVAQGTSGVLASEGMSDAWNAVFLSVLLVWFVALVNLLYLFPDGRFVPRWTRWAFVPWGLGIAGAIGWVFATLDVPPPWYWTGLIVLTLAIFALGGLAQIYRYRRVSNAVQRQQTKWVVAGFSVFIASEVLWSVYANLLVPLLGLDLPRGLAYEVIGTLLGTGVQMIMPLTIGAAVLRYRLWDIDVVIERTLVYTILTALLTAAYFLSVVALQEGAMLVTGQRGSALVTVLSTLLIAALFLPLRAGVQRFIDRRFFRRKYDAARTLAAFGANLRDDVDLGHLQDTLLLAVVEVMQPEQVGLWIRLNVPTDVGEEAAFRWSEQVKRTQD
jgi:hypothetical protein